jgi:hypothetical protein
MQRAFVYPIAPITLLLAACRPTAIARFVSPVVVDAVDRQPRRRLSHIREEGFKTVSPSVADGDASTSVVGEARNVGVETAGFQRLPTPVGRANFPARRMAMCSVFPSRANATATGSYSSFQIVAEHNEFRSAIAAASPKSVALSAVREPGNGEPPKFLTRNVDACGHAGDLA